MSRVLYLIGVAVIAGASCRAIPESSQRPPGPAQAHDDKLADATPGSPAGDASAMSDPANAIARLERVAASPALGGQPGVEITLTSARPFPALGELATLRIGPRSFTLSRYAGADLHALVFTLTPAELDSAADGDAVAVEYGDPAPPGRSWQFGPLRKADLR